MKDNSVGKIVAIVVIIVLALGVVVWSIKKTMHPYGYNPNTLTDEQRAKMLRPGGAPPAPAPGAPQPAQPR